MLKRIAMPLGIVAVLIFAVSVLNKGIDRNAQDDGDRDLAKATGLDTDDSSTQDQQQQQQQSGEGAFDQYPTEAVFGNYVKPKYNLQIGWYYDENMMSGKKNAIDGILHMASAWAMANPSTHGFEMVDLDTPPADRSPTCQGITTLGLTVNGKLIKAGNAGTAYTVQDVQAALNKTR